LFSLSDLPLLELLWIICLDTLADVQNLTFRGRFVSSLVQDSLLMTLSRGMLEDFKEILNEVGVGIFSFKLGSIIGHFKIPTDLSLGFPLLQFSAYKTD